MSLVISTGSNLGNRESNLFAAKSELSDIFKLIEESPIYESPAVDYLNQPDFLNQILAFEIPEQKPEEVIESILKLELSLGRKREIDKGPRTIDIDILFWDQETIDLPQLQVPHPRLFERSFIVLPLKELQVFDYLSKAFNFPDQFPNQAWPLNSPSK